MCPDRVYHFSLLFQNQMHFEYDCFNQLFSRTLTDLYGTDSIIYRIDSITDGMAYLVSYSFSYPYLQMCSKYNKLYSGLVSNMKAGIYFSFLLIRLFLFL